MEELKKPNNTKFILAVIIIFMGIALSIGVFITMLFMSTNDSYKFVAPSSSSTTLEEGKYTIYHEFISDFEDGEYNSNESDINSISLIVINNKTSELVNIEKPMGYSTYNISGDSGYAIYNFELLEETSITFETVSTDDTQVVLNVNGGGVGIILLAIFILLFGISGSVVAGVILILLNVSKISKYNKAMVLEQLEEEIEVGDIDRY